MNAALEQAKSVPVASLRRYLLLHGWSRKENIRNDIDLFTLRTSDVGELEIVLPQTGKRIDALRRVADALRTLSQLEDRDLDRVVADVRAIGVDVWRAIVPDALVVFEAVHLNVVGDFIKNAKGLLAAAATTEAAPKPFFGRVTKTAARYADDCRFGHTFRGSFGFSIESPIVPNEAPAMFEETPPLERRIMQRLVRGIKHVALAGDAGDASPIFQNYQTGFSANMCEDFVDLMAAVRGQSLEFEFAFSPEWRTAPDVGEKVKIEVGAKNVALVKDAARQLRLQDFERNQTVVGRVVRLESESDPSDLFQPDEREIMIQWNSENFGNIRVRTTLPAEQYLAALDAHGKGQFVSVAGLIDRVGRFWVLLDPSNFQVLPQASR